jgi:hypothetical protein
MVLENVTGIITSVVDGTTSSVESNPYVWLFLIMGGIIGTFLALMLPFLREKRKFGKEGIELLFDKEFLKVAAGSLAISIITIGSIYPQLLANTDSSASYGSAFIAAATLAFTLNIGGNWIIGSNNSNAELKLVEKKAEQLVALKLVQEQQQNKTASGTDLPKDTVGGSDSVTQP